MAVHDDTIHLCNECGNKDHFPSCMPANVQFGNGFGNDNIIACRNRSDKDVVAEIRAKYQAEVTESLDTRPEEVQNPFDPDTSEIRC